MVVRAGTDTRRVDAGRRCLAEAIGTFVLVFATVGATIVSGSLVGVATATGLALAAAITALGPVSGAHFNPAVTLVDRMFGTITTTDAILYAIAQTVGGCVGAVIANIMFELDPINISTKSRSSGALWLSEVVATIGLLLVIHGCVRTGRASAVPFAVGVWIGGAYWFTSSTSFANPAVTVARTLSDSFAGIKPSSAPMFIVMQLVGAVLAFVLIRFLYPHPLEE